MMFGEDNWGTTAERLSMRGPLVCTLAVLVGAELSEQGASAKERLRNTQVELPEGKQCTAFDVLDYDLLTYFSDRGPEDTKEIAFKSTEGCAAIFVSKTKLRDDGAAALAAALSAHPHDGLEALNVYGCDITPGGVKKLAASMPRGLQALAIGKNEVGDEGAIALAEAFKKTPLLVSIDMSRAQIGTDGLDAMMATLARHPLLTFLRLDRNRAIDDEGAESLARALAVNTALRSVDLSMTNVTDVGAKALLGALQNGAAPTLQQLGLSGTAVSRDVLLELGALLKRRDEERMAAEEKEAAEKEGRKEEL